MNDEAALLQAIVESPDDIQLRLVFADWCEEHGHTARAALIRGQCFLDPLFVPADPDEDSLGHFDHNYIPHSRLRPDIAAEVLGVVATLTDVEHAIFEIRRGFLERLTLVGVSALMDCLHHAKAIFSQHPLRVFQVYRLYNSPIADSVEPPHLPVELVRQLVATPGLDRIEEFDLSGYAITDEGARLLSQARWKPRLLRLQTQSQPQFPANARKQLQIRFGSALHLLEDVIPF